jgi:excisionase family DNA binding protein
VSVTLVGFDDTLRLIVREELAAQLHRQARGWLNVESAARYLDTTPDAIRGMVKRGQVKPHRTPTGRLLFRPEDLDEWVQTG